ncbi:MAG TPA: tetratricopeptide repeat protein, partial [Pyrinomonadaceae bacterium]
ICLAPEDSRPHVALGNCFSRKGWYSEAIKMFRRGLELKPYCTEADVRVFLAEALVKNGQIKDACAEWRRVLEIEAGYPSYDVPHKEAKMMLAKYCVKA